MSATAASDPVTFSVQGTPFVLSRRFVDGAEWMPKKLCDPSSPFAQQPGGGYVIDADPASFRMLVAVMKGTSILAHELQRMAPLERNLLRITAEYLLCIDIAGRIEEFERSQGALIPIKDHRILELENQQRFLQTSVTEKASEIAKLQMEKQALERDARTKQTTIGVLANEKQDLEADNRNLEKTLFAKVVKISMLEEDCRQMKDDRKTYDKRISDLEKDKDRKAQLGQRYDQKLADLSSAKRRVSEYLRLKEGHFSHSEAQNRHLNRCLQTMETNVSGLEHDRRRLVAELDAQRHRIAQLEQDKLGLQRRLKANDAIGARTQRHLEQARKVIPDLQNEKRRLQRIVRSYSEEPTDLGSAKRHLEQGRTGPTVAGGWERPNATEPALNWRTGRR